VVEHPAPSTGGLASSFLCKCETSQAVTASSRYTKFMRLKCYCCKININFGIDDVTHEYLVLYVRALCSVINL